MERGLNLITFLLFDLIYFQSNSFIVRLLGTLIYKRQIKIITLHFFILNYNYFCWFLMATFLFSLKWKPASLRVGQLYWRRTEACSRWIIVFGRSPLKSKTWNAESHVIRWVIHFQNDQVKYLGILNHTNNMFHSLVESNFRAGIPSLKNLC